MRREGGGYLKTFAEGTVETMKREQVCSEDNWKEWA